MHSPAVPETGGVAIQAVAQRKKDWINIAFLMLTPVVGIVGTALYTWWRGFEPWMLVLMLTMYALVGMSICAGYHRYFSHKSYETSRPVQLFFAFFGAMAAQNSILWWSAGHRIHHKYVDKDWDPYSIKRGFWWAHIFWIFYKQVEKEDSFENARDLQANPIVMWQHRWTTPILIIGGFGIPTLIGAAFGDPIAGLLWGGFLRVVVVHHTTFFVNSLAHTLGKPTYNAEVSARDNWLVALATLGEGYHSFHHRFPADYRNGIRWYHWDPAKWFIVGLRAVGLARDLRFTPPPQIEQARLRAALLEVEPQISTAPARIADDIRARLNASVQNLETAVSLWRQHLEERASGVSRAWRDTRRAAKEHIRRSRREWKLAVRMLERAHETA